MRGWSLADRRTPEKRPSRKLRQKTVVREAACTRTVTWCCCWVCEVCAGSGPDALGGSDGTGVLVLVVVWFICYCYFR